MRDDQFEDFKEDVKAGLSMELVSEVYDLPLAETKRAIKYVNRTWLECLITGFMQLFRKIVFEVRMKIRMSKIRQLSRKVNTNAKYERNNKQRNK